MKENYRFKKEKINISTKINNNDATKPQQQITSFQRYTLLGPKRSTTAKKLLRPTQHLSAPSCATSNHSASIIQAD